MGRFLAAATAIAVGIMSAIGATPASARTLDDIIKSGTIRIGVNPTLPPLGKYDDKNQIVGFDVDFAGEIAKLLGVKLEVVAVNSPDRIPFVTSGKVDAVLGGMTRNTERAKVIAFSAPVYTEALGVLTTQDKPFASWKDLDKPGITLVEVRGTTPVTFIQANIKNAKVLLLDNYPDVIRALAQGRGDAMIDVVDYVGDYMNQYQVKWKVLKEPIDVDYDGIGLAKDATGLKDWLNVAVFSLHNSGKTAEMWKKWFGIDMLFPVPITPFF